MSNEKIEVLIPSILGGESISEGSIKDICVKVGDFVSVDDLMFEIETDKTVLEINAPKSGKVIEIFVKTDDTVIPSQKVSIIEQMEQSDLANSASESKGKVSEQKNAEFTKRNAPSADVIMNDNKIDPSTIKGSGLGERITKKDVLSEIEKRTSNVAIPSSSGKKVEAEPVIQSNLRSSVNDVSDRDSKEEIVRMSRLRKVTAKRLKETQNNAAILSTFNEIDLSKLMKLRSENKELFEKKFGVRLGFMSFFIKAVVSALKLIPEINAEIVGEDIVYKRYYDIGVAVGSDRGLVVPVIRDVDDMSFSDIEFSMSDFASRARSGKLKVSEISGATFTISNGGVYGSLLSTPIINSTQSGILGMHAIKERPVVVDGEICIRPMMYVALSYDHRIVDGKGAVTFLVHIKDLIEDPSKMLLGF